MMMSFGALAKPFAGMSPTEQPAFAPMLYRFPGGRRSLTGIA